MSQAYRRWGKRTLDLGFALLAGALFFPIIALVAVMVKWNLGSPVLFRQERIGKNCRPFTLVKFRSMLPASSETRDADRLTRFGRFLRSTSLDEVPELWNVIKGDMSLVGPRPLLPEYLNYYSSEQARRHLVRPGITGLAQVNGRNRTTWERRLAFDVEYVNDYSLRMDAKIALLTIHNVLNRTSVEHPETGTMPPFKGIPPMGPGD